MSLLRRILYGQENGEIQGIIPGLGGLAVRRSYLVIVGSEAPEGEIANAQAISAFLRRSLNIAVGGIIPIKDNSPGIQLLSQLSNVVVVGGPYANEFAFKINEFINPKLDITISREKTPEETWPEYIASGALVINGYICDEKPYSNGPNTGIIGTGRARMFDKVIAIGGGGKFEDTCAMGKAFREGAGPGIFNCSWTEVPDMSICPEDAEYTKSVEPAQPE